LVKFPATIQANEEQMIIVHFNGHPKEAIKPPWDAGWIFAKDKKGRPWMSLACEGTGAAIWLPCKNTLYDEPDNGVAINITVPDTLVGVANGRLIKTTRNEKGTTTYHWVVKNPINGYDICPYIGKYVSWHHNYPGLKSKLDCDYWVLDYNLAKSKTHFAQIDTFLHCFEEWLGPYPFYEDSYKVVESPMLGMEHQSGIAYGNDFQNGYIKGNLSGTSWGLNWDFILVHESGHEWFGNSVTAASGADSWIHEGFTKYLETIYTEYLNGKEAGNEYTRGIWKRIKNDAPIIGSGSSDEYNKGCALLHMIRQIVGDSLFKRALHDLQRTFYHQTITTDQVLRCMSSSCKMDLSRLFAQYLRTVQVPELQYFFSNKTLHYQWMNCVEGFDMPVRVSLKGKTGFFITPGTQWKQRAIAGSSDEELTIDGNFYVGSRKTAPATSR
jgi:aminopeptidase N